jgi:hypothetical protein
MMDLTFLPGNGYSDKNHTFRESTGKPAFSLTAMRVKAFWIRGKLAEKANYQPGKPKQ